MSNSLPDEILITIFQYLHSNDLVKCQLVCRSWHHPARTQHFKKVWLRSTRAIELFITTMELDHNQRYLKSVKSIAINPDDEHDTIVLHQHDIVKLFFRSPNLEEVSLRGLDQITNFSEDLSRLFLKYCPKLRSFEIDVDEEDDCIDPWLEKVQPILTAITLSEYCQMITPEAVQFLTQFPRLRSIKSRNVLLGGHILFLPVLERLSNVDTPSLALICNMRKGAGEGYLSTRTQEVQDQVIERLSKIRNLSIKAYGNIGNDLQFVSKYCTGLNNIHVERLDYEGTANDEEDLFHENLFNLIPSEGKLFYDLEGMHFTSLVNNFATLIQNVFEKVPKAYKQSKKRVLGIALRDRGIISSHMASVSLRNEQTPFSRNLHIGVGQELPTMVNLFKNGAPMDQIDVFALRFPTMSSYSPPRINAQNYLQLLEIMPSLKVVKLDVPCWFDDPEPKEDDQLYSGPILSLVEEAVFNVAAYRGTGYLLERCSFAFPNLKLLSLNDFCGVWKPSLGEFQLSLQQFTLEQLTLDMDPVIIKTKMRLCTNFDAFIVLEVEIQSLRKKRTYKISTNLSCDEITGTQELKNSRCNEDYLYAKIVVKSLGQLQLFSKESWERNSCIIMLDD